MLGDEKDIRRKQVLHVTGLAAKDLLSDRHGEPGELTLVVREG